LGAKLTTLLCKEIIVAKSKAKTGCNPAEPSKEGSGPKWAVLLIMIMVMMIHVIEVAYIKFHPSMSKVSKMYLQFI
jgi:hypothetical protein